MDVSSGIIVWSIERRKSLRMKKRKIKIFVGVVCGLLLGAFLVCFFMINAKYRNSTVVEKGIGEPVDYNNLQFTVTDAGFMPHEKSDELWADELDTFPGCKGYYVTVTVNNTGTEEKKLSLGNFELVSDAWINGVDLEKFLTVNSDDIKQKFLLKPGDSITCTLPFLIVKENFTNKQWEQIEHRNFELVLSIYPVKRIVNLSE